MSNLMFRPPPPKWEAKRGSKKTLEKKIYTFRKGQVESYDFSEVKSLKRTRSLNAKGQVFQIEKPESLLKKLREPQTKLWYYDKRNYAPRSLPDINKKPTFKLYQIAKPKPADPLRTPTPKLRSPSPLPRTPSPKARTPTPKPRTPTPLPPPPPPKERTPTPKPRKQPPKEPTPVPEPEPEPVIEPIIVEDTPVQAKAKNESMQRAAPVPIPVVVPVPVVSLPLVKSVYTLESISKSMKYYRF